MGFVMAYFSLTSVNGGFPYKDSLSEVNGYISWVKEHKYGIRFSFMDNDLNFNYPSKSKGLWTVKNALVNSKGKVVTVLYKTNEGRLPIKPENEYHNVFEITENENVIRSYVEVQKAWKSDNKLMPIIIALFLLGGPYIWWEYGRKKNA